MNMNTVHFIRKDCWPITDDSRHKRGPSNFQLNKPHAITNASSWCIFLLTSWNHIFIAVSPHTNPANLPIQLETRHIRSCYLLSAIKCPMSVLPFQARCVTVCPMLSLRVLELAVGSYSPKSARYISPQYLADPDYFFFNSGITSENISHLII